MQYSVYQHAIGIAFSGKLAAASGALPVILRNIKPVEIFLGQQEGGSGQFPVIG
jgi:hypothetical protein